MPTVELQRLRALLEKARVQALSQRSEQSKTQSQTKSQTKRPTKKKQARPRHEVIDEEL